MSKLGWEGGTEGDIAQYTLFCGICLFFRDSTSLEAMALFLPSGGYHLLNPQFPSEWCYFIIELCSETNGKQKYSHLREKCRRWKTTKLIAQMMSHFSTCKWDAEIEGEHLGSSYSLYYFHRPAPEYWNKQAWCCAETKLQKDRFSLAFILSGSWRQAFSEPSSNMEVMIATVQGCCGKHSKLL